MSELQSMSITPVVQSGDHDKETSDEKRSVVTVHRQLQRNQYRQSWMAVAQQM